MNDQAPTPDHRITAIKTLIAGVVALGLGIVATYKLGGPDAGVERTLVYVGLIAGGVYAILWGAKSLLSDAVARHHATSGDTRERGTIPLVHARYRYLGWLVFLAVLSVVFFSRFGSFGTFGGVVTVAWAATHGWRVAQTFLAPAGEFRIRDGAVDLPAGPCRRGSVKTKLSAIEQVYFLRRQAPWNRTAPVLVVEVEGRGYAYPRDWFLSDTDQQTAADLLTGRPTKVAAAD